MTPCGLAKLVKNERKVRRPRCHQHSVELGGNDLEAVLSVSRASYYRKAKVRRALRGGESLLRLKSTTKFASNFYLFAPLFRSRRELSGDTWIEVEFVDFKKL